MWNVVVLPALIYELMGTAQGNSYVGYIEAAQGCINLIVALPIGWLADKTSKSAIVRLGGVLIPVAGGATMFAVVYGVGHRAEVMLSYWILFGAMCVWGLCYAIWGGPCQALLADSTPTGQRSWYFTKLAQLSFAANAAGPLVAIIIFALHGDRWELSTLRNVLLVGVGIEMLMTPLMMSVSDDCALEEEGDEPSETPAVIASAAAEPMTPARGDAADVPADVVPRAARTSSADARSSASDAVASPPNAAEEAPAAAVTAADAGATHGARLWLVPYVIFAQGLFVSLGSGMTIKFFPLFLCAAAVEPPPLQARPSQPDSALR